MYKVSCPIPGTKFYSQFETLDDASSLKSLREAWTTPEQAKYNAEHETCSTCRGRGYKVYRDKGGHTVRENVGCHTCKGTGATPRMWPSRA